MDPLIEHRWLFLAALAVAATALLLLRDWIGTLRSTESEVNVESVISRGLRRAAGTVSLLSLGVAVLGVLGGYGDFASFGFLVFVILPWATMITHLGLTRCLNKEEKALWRRELPWSHRSFIALWAYMFSTDLRERARGFGPYRPQDSGHESDREHQ